MNEGIPRPLLVLAGIVVLAAVFVGVKDYFQKPRETQPTASASPSVTPSNTTTVAKKAGSTKLRRVRISSTGNAANTSDSAADDIEGRSSSKESGEAGSETSDDYAQSTVAQAARDGAEAAMERQGDEINAKIVRLLFSPPKCVPLPNLVINGDVDAPYYENWAREYSCRLR